MLRAGHMLRAIAAFAALVLLAGCGKSSDLSLPEPTVHWPTDFDTLATQSMPTGAVTPTNIAAGASLMATFEVAGLRSAFAWFTDGIHFVDAGGVQVRAHAPVGPGSVQRTLDELVMTVGATPWYLYTSLPSYPLGINLTFDGGEHHAFTVTGSTAVAAFTDSVKSVAHPAVSAPANAATAARATDLAVAWSDAGSDTTLYVLAVVTSQVDSTRIAFSDLVRDTQGAASIPASRLGALPAGAARLAVARWRLGYRVSGGRTTALLCEAVEVRNLTLN